NGRTLINQYVRPKLVPAKGPYPQIQRLLEELIPDPEGRRWFFHWFAAKVQCPTLRMNTAPIFQTRPGWGKDTLGRIIFHILGVENCTTIGQDDLESSFNAHYASKLFILADEVTTRENLNDRTGPLKQMVAGPTLQLHPKGITPQEIPNRG